MSKLKIVDRRSEESIMSERNLLSTLNHNFIVNMYFAFQDFYNLYLVMDLLTGGDLRYHIAYKKIFSEQETKFFISNMILALEYIHSKNIIHRDIKPENLVLESNGYLRITDFGVAKINEEDNSSETSGTPGYMAPEVILILNHTFVSDFFALGVIGYEFMLGYRPYLGGSRNEIKQLIISKQAKVEKEDIPDDWSMEAVDFINRLLLRKAKKRLGYNGIHELKNHTWMKDVDWEKLSEKKIEPPFVPEKNSENFDKNYCEGEDDIGEETVERYQIYAQSDLYPDVFKNYTYCNLSYISNYHIKRLKRFKENHRKIKDIIDQNVKASLNDQKKMKDSSTGIENLKKNRNLKKNESLYNIHNYNNYNNNIENNDFNLINERKYRSKSVEELNKYNVDESKDNNSNKKENKETKDVKESKEIKNNSKIEKENIKNDSNDNTNQERNIINISNQFNNNINNNYFTIDANKSSNSKSKKKFISKKNTSKNQKLKQQIKNFNEKIVYNNYINLHFNNFSTNKNSNNNNFIDNSNRDSNYSNQKITNIKAGSNISKKIKPKISIKKKQIGKIKKNTIVKSSSMKMIQNNKNMFDYILSINKSGTNNNPKKINQKNLEIKKENIKNYENKSDIVINKKVKEEKNSKLKNFKNNKKANLLMDIINNNNFKNVKINKTKIIKSKSKKNKTYGNRINKCHSSIGFFNTEKISSIHKKNNNSNLKLSKTNRTHLSMHNISNSNDYYYNLFDNKNYNTINAQSNYSIFTRNKSKKNIRLIYNNKNLNTYLSNNCDNNKKNQTKSINTHKLSSIDFSSKNIDKNCIKYSFDYMNNKKIKKFIHKQNSKNKRNDSKNKNRYNIKYFESK